uniref:Resolvase HTH domain-containing protein n=1 Tax=Amphimedon queenslandica TaxID=400682 RepID=A0A1X7U1S5_AMPQE
MSEDESVASDMVRTTLEALRSLEVQFEKTIVISAPMCDTLNGRPRFRIPKAQLEYLVENNFTALQMASIIGVSVRTIYRRLADFEVSLSSKYSNLTDDELDESVSSVQNMGVGRL